MLAATFLAPDGWLLAIATVALVAVVVIGLAYRKGPVERRTLLACAVLKTLGFAALLLCLLNPLRTAERAKPGANFIAILADNSQGLQIKDNGKPRSEVIQSALTHETKWLDGLGEHFQLRRYAFDSTIRSVDAFADLKFDGRATRLRSALQTLRERYTGQPLAGVVLFSDGNATDGAGTQFDLTGLPPIYCVAIGGDDLIKDIAIKNVSVQQSAFEDTPVTIQAEISASDYRGFSIVAQLYETTASGGTTGSKLVSEENHNIMKVDETVSFRFQPKPEGGGLRFYELKVAPRAARLADPPPPDETTVANNSRVVVVDRGQGPYRILYVGGRPNWEYKFLRRSIESDPQLDLVAIIRVAKREPKFDFRGRAGESSNPLFRGFEKQSADEVERYDQPVLVRLNTKDESELRAGFPKLAEDLFSFHAVILDDLEAAFFTTDQMALLQKFVSERGGGLLMLGGAESFFHGKYHRTPIGDVLPVYLDQAPEPRPPGQWKLALTREGWLEPWARLRSTEKEETTRMAAMPPFQVLNRVRGIKPGAVTVAAVADSKGQSYPALVTQRFGHGRVGAWTVGDIWRWGLQNEASRADMEKSWRQLLRWLVVDVPAFVELRTEASAETTEEAVHLKILARDKTFQALDNATVNLSVRQIASTNSGDIRMTAEADANQAGAYNSTFLSRDNGGYLAEATVVDPNGASIGRARAGWTANPAAEEFKSLKPNRALLEMIASKTGGAVLKLSDLDGLARSFPNRAVPVMEVYTYPWWHNSPMILFALACFIGEWALRRWRGLA